MIRLCFFVKSNSTVPETSEDMLKIVFLADINLVDHSRSYKMRNKTNAFVLIHPLPLLGPQFIRQVLYCVYQKNKSMDYWKITMME